jgi:hypothetical protein
MRSAYPLYLAARIERTQEAARCCDDRPPAATAERSPRLRRTRKVARGLPASFRVFRRSLRSPLPTPALDGQKVVTQEGALVGHISDQVVALGSGRAALVIVPDRTEAPASTVLLLPPEVLRRSVDAGVAVLVPGWERSAVA